MMTDELDTNDGLTRREALKKGARLGGALVWAVPVVQTVGMSSALAQTVSEGTCCLKIVSLTAEIVGDGNDIRVEALVQNCGSETITDVIVTVQRRFNDGPWEFIQTLGTSELDPTDTADLGTTRFNRDAGSYQYRVKGGFTCLGTVFTQHTVPGTEWVESAVVVAVDP